MDLTPDLVLELVKRPEIWTDTPYLSAMRGPADRAVAAMAKVKPNCSPCQKKAANDAQASVYAAFAALVESEAKRNPTAMAALRTKLCGMLGRPAEPLTLKFKRGAQDVALEV